MSAIFGALISGFAVGVLAPAGSKLARRAASSISDRFDADLKVAEISLAQTGETIRPVAAIRSEFRPIVPDLGRIESVDQAKTEVFSAIASSPLYTGDEIGFRELITKLDRSKTMEAVRTAANGLSNFLETENQKVFGKAVRNACERASQRVGFTTFETIPNRVSDGQIRFAATDVLGRTLVTEINMPLGRDVRIDTEVLGVSDNSCHQLLEDFHEALRLEGVQISGPPKRESTGGICTSAAAKEFLALKAPVKRHRKVAPGSAAGKTRIKKLAVRKEKRNEIRTGGS